MSEQASSASDWEAVVMAHPLESHDPAEWLHYAVALSQMIESSSQARQQQQQAGLAFAHAEALGASKEAVAQSLRQATLLGLADALALADADPAAVALCCLAGWP